MADPESVRAPRESAPPRGIRDRRGEGTVVATLAALAGADTGVVAVVADAAHRRAVLTDVLDPARLGLDVAVIAGRRCDLGGAGQRLAAATERPSLSLVEYALLPDVTLPPDAHIALVDPPPDEDAARWVASHAAQRWLHLLWGDEEAAFALQMAIRRWELRPVAAEIWRALSGAGHQPWGDALDALLLGTGDTLRPPGAVADALQALAEIGLLQIDDRGVTSLPGSGRRLEDAPRTQACSARLEATRSFIARSASLSFGESAVSYDDVRATG